MEVTREQEISQIQMNKPHLVILGAGELCSVSEWRSKR